MLLDIRKDILRHGGKSVGSGGGKLRSAPEAPQCAHGRQTGVVSRKDVHVTVPHKEGGSGVCADLVHQLVQSGGIGLGGHPGAVAPDRGKASGTKIVLDDLAAQGVWALCARNFS